MKKLLSTAFVYLIAGATLLAGAAPALGGEASSFGWSNLSALLRDDPILPAEWEGVWVVVQEQQDCEGNVQDTSTDTLNLCAGEAPPTGGAGELSCTGTVTGTTIDLDCSFSQQLFPNCQVVSTVTIEGSRSGDSATLTSTINATAQGTAIGCDAIPDTCIKVVGTMTRTGQEPDCTGVGNEPSSWGTMKARFQ